MISLKNIKKEYIMGENVVQVLKGIDLEIGDGDFISIMGPSGSGKSTLMNIIGMLDVATSGTYDFNGIKVDGLKENQLSKIRGKNIGFIFQNYNLISRMSVLKQVMLPLAYQGVSKRQREKLAIESLTKVGLQDKLDSKPNELSGGQQQRVSIARALAVNPGMILADEPTGALDTVTGQEIMKLLTELNKEGKTIVLITHEPDIGKYAKRHIMIKDGLIIKE
ncbi:MAG: ABC transporter ATP-binding protein [Candidatus Gracilibacteria bacterium]